MANFLLGHDEENQRQYSLKCQVCKSRFDIYVNVPRILPCLHTVCTECITKNLCGSSFFCPCTNCDKTHNARTGGANYFQEDSLAILLLKENETIPWCDKCDVENYTKIYCSTCDDLFCNKCIKQHKNSKSGRDHIYINIDDILNAKRCRKSEINFAYCAKPGHGGFELDTFCSGKTCNYAICKQCKKLHSDTSLHRTQPLMKVVPKLQQEIIKLASELETKEQILHSKRERCNQELGKEHKILIDVEKNIDKFATEEKKEKMKNIAIMKMTRKIKIINEDLKEVDSDLNSLCSIRRSAKYSVAFTPVFKFLEDVDKIKRQIQSIIDATIHAYPSTSLEMIFCPGHLQSGVYAKESKMVHAKESEMVISTMAFTPYTNISIPKWILKDDNVEVSILLKSYRNVLINEPYLDVEAVISNNGHSFVVKCLPRGNCYIGDFIVKTIGKHRMEVWAIKRKLLLGTENFTVDPSSNQIRSAIVDDESGDDGHSNSHLTTDITCVRMKYGPEAFPKIRHLLGEYGMLTKSLHSLRGVLEMTVINDFTSNLKNIFQDTYHPKPTGGVFPVPTEQIFACNDVLRNHDINDVYINIIGTPDHIKILRDLVSPKYQPKSTTDLGDVDSKCCQHGCNSHDSFIRSLLFNAPEIYICWIPENFELLEILDKFDKRTLTRMFFVTDSNNTLDLQEQIREHFDLDESQNRDFPIVCTAIQENVRKHATFTLGEYIFGRLNVLKLILLKCEENIRNIQSNPRNMCIQCMSSIVRDTKIPDKQDTDEHTDTEISEEDRKLCKVLEKKIFHVNSLLQQNPRKEKKAVHPDISEDAVKKLLRLREQGVEAFGVWSDEFRVYINIEQLTEDRMKRVEAEILKIIADEFNRVNIIRCKGEMIVKYVEQGDKLFRKESNRHGTLGIFARDSSDNLIALTSEHVILKDEKAFVDIDGKREELGLCHKTTADNDTPCHASDFSLIKIHPENYSRCNTEFKSHTGEVLEPNLFEGENAELLENMVYKKGANSNWTTGGIRGGVNINDNDYILVEGHDGPFALPGDSGSIVFTYDIYDSENTKIYLVSMVVGGEQTEGVLTYRLDKTLNKLSPNTLKFDHQKSTKPCTFKNTYRNRERP